MRGKHVDRWQTVGWLVQREMVVGYSEAGGWLAIQRQVVVG